MLSTALKSITHMRCVPVIVSFSTDGEIKPLYTMINSIQLKIESSVQEIPHEGKNWIIFRYSVIDDNMRKQIKLHYCVNEHAWFASIEYFSE